MKTLIKTTFPFFMLLLAIASCKDEEEDVPECCVCSFTGTICEDAYPGDWVTYRNSLISIGCTCSTGNNNNNNNNNNITICQGNGENTYIPLKSSNRWFLAYNGSGSFFDRRIRVTGTETHDSKQYFVVLNEEVNGSNGSSFHDWELLLRKDSNGDIYQYYPNDSREYLYVPVNPSANQTINTYDSGNYRKVTAVSTTFSTDNCSYTGVLQIEDFSSNGSSSTTTYFKKGVGFIGEDQFVGDLELEEVTLN